MNIKILTAEESLEYWNKEKEERRKWPLEQIIEDAKFGLSLPGTKYILQHQYDDFFEWIKTEEAMEQWNELPMTQHLVKYYSEKISIL